MVNPYAVNSRQTNKPQIQLGQSQAIKKFEKFQAKYSTTGTTSGSKKQFRKKKNSDNDSDDNDDDDDDDDSLFKNAKQTANKFMKKKQSATPVDETETDSDQTFTESKQSDISVDIDRSSTPIPAKRQQKQQQQQQQITKIPTSRIRSATSSVSSIRSLNRRSVKFVKTNKNQSFSSNHDEINGDNDDDDESTIIDEVMSNLILDIDDLEASTSNLYKTNKKKSTTTTTTKRLSKSPLAMAAQKRSESVTSIIEDNEEDLNDEESKASSGSSDKSLSLRKNLILDVNELARSLSEQDDSSLKKKKQSETDKKKTKKEEKKSSDKNKKKEQKNKSRKTPSIISESKSSIETESITDNDADVYQDEYTKPNQISESENELTRTKASVSKHRHASARLQQTYNSDFETEATLKSSRNINKPSVQKRNAEIQVDPTDLLKNSEFLTTVNVYNPSSILLATTSHLNTASTLKDLNQLTGYTMINQAFNDLMKMNLSFVSNFLTSQRNLYEQQIKSIRPKEYNN
jgi:hypothetical protein